MPKTKVKEFKPLTFKVGSETTHTLCRHCKSVLYKSSVNYWACSLGCSSSKLQTAFQVEAKENHALREEHGRATAQNV